MSPRAVMLVSFPLSFASACAPSHPPQAGTSAAGSAEAAVDRPGDGCTPDGDVRIESVFTPGFPPSTMRLVVEGHCASLVSADGARVGVYRAQLGDGDLRDLVGALSAAPPTERLVPDMPVRSVDLRTADRRAQYLVPLPPRSPAAQSIVSALSHVDQIVLHRPFATVRATLDVPAVRANEPAKARVTLANDGAIATDVAVDSVTVIAVPKPVITPRVAPLPVTPREVGKASGAKLRIDPSGTATIALDIAFPSPGAYVVAARVRLALDVSAANVEAPDGSSAVQAARLQSPDVTIDVGN